MAFTLATIAAMDTRSFAPISPAPGMPLYRAVKRALLRAIEDGTLAPGATLPLSLIHI